MEEHVQRMLDESVELKKRIERLEAFIGTDTFNALPHVKRNLMIDQFYAMDYYDKVLNERIELEFKK